MKKLYLAMSAGLLLLITSCASVSTPAGVGGIYTNVTSGEAVTSNPLGKKVGTASAQNILGIIAMGDASIQAAAQEAGIKRISHVDSQKTSFLGLYAKYSVTVYGD